MDNAHQNDREQLAIARLEYAQLTVGQSVSLADRLFGYVLEHVYEADGFQLFVIADRPTQPQEITVLFKGSSGLIKGTPETWTNEWLDTNLPISLAMLFRTPMPPSQLQTAARVLNRVLKQYASASAYLYGHSLAAINLQYALAHCRFIGQVKRANLYEGPNLYGLFNGQERKHVRAFKHKTNNFVDVYDPITLGYTDARHLVGQLRYLDSNWNPPIVAHMWGGYRFDQDGRLLTRRIDQRFMKKADLYRRMFNQGQALHASWDENWQAIEQEFKRADFQTRWAKVLK